MDPTDVQLVDQPPESEWKPAPLWPFPDIPWPGGGSGGGGGVAPGECRHYTFALAGLGIGIVLGAVGAVGTYLIGKFL